MDASARVRDVRSRLYLHTVGISVTVADVLDDSLVSAVAVEDACWTIAYRDWLARRPRRWQRRKMATWQAEHDSLFERRSAVRSIARTCGLLAV